jgi:hypothetical protein
MADGRHFTDYRPHCHLESLIRQQNSIQSSFQSRLFLTQNAQELMELNRKEACNKNCCGPCQAPYQLSTTMPENQASVVGGGMPCGQKESVTPMVPPHGNAPLQCDSWDTGVINVSEKNCCSPPSDASNYYPTSMQHVMVQRKSIPGGGVPLQGGDPNMYY